MLEVQRIRSDRSTVEKGLRKRGIDPKILDEVIALDDRRKQLQGESDALARELNDLAKQIGERMKSGDREGGEALKQTVADKKQAQAPLAVQHGQTVHDLEERLLEIPNIPHPSVPEGRTPTENEVFRDWKDKLPELGGDARPHWDLGPELNLFDLELGVKLTGSGFPVYRGKGARLQRALVSFFLDRATEAGYEEVLPPHLVNEETARATGQLPDKEGQMYYVTADDLYLIPTAEVPVTNIHRGDIIDRDKLPIKLCGYTPCFRREAGSYGKDVRGLNRVHQFDKVEIVRIEHPENSYAALDDMLDHVSKLLDDLRLPYRILRLCGGDMGFTSALTYDFEVWSAAQERWLEVSSVSNFETFQSNRLKLRVRDGNERVLAHTLNGSALALARIVAALLENNQTTEGIVIPEVLRPYTGFDLIPFN